MHASPYDGERTYEATRVLGLVNLVIAALGLIQLAVNIMGYLALPSSFINQYAPFMRNQNRFATMSLIALVLLLPLGILGIQLRRRQRYAIAATEIFFIIEIFAFLGILWTWSMPFLPVSPAMIAAGLMNGGIALQILTAYPLVGLILLVREDRRSQNT